MSWAGPFAGEKAVNHRSVCERLCSGMPSITGFLIQKVFWVPGTCYFKAPVDTRHSHLSQLEHRKMRKVMRKKVATDARLPKRMICVCPSISKLPSDPMVGAGSGTGCWGQSVLPRWRHGGRGRCPPAERTASVLTTSQERC